MQLQSSPRPIAPLFLSKYTNATASNENLRRSNVNADAYSATRRQRAQKRADSDDDMDTAQSDYSGGSSTRFVSRKRSNIGTAPVDDDFGDLYRTPTSTTPRNFPGATHDRNNKRKPSNMDLQEDNSKWIHRDKLAQIESRELEEAGYRLPARNMSRAASSRSSSRHKKEMVIEQQQQEDFNGEDLNGTYSRQRIVSPQPVEEELDDADWDAGSPDDIQMERRQTSSSKSASSRIPIKRGLVAANSTAPDREANQAKPLKQGAGWAGSQTDGSASVGDEPEEATPPNTQPASPASAKRARVPSKAKPTSGTRKASNTSVKSGVATGQRSTSSPEKRPGTSSGRPSTSQGPPEGDPPWLSAFKPDPRLPPDQQMLPTHAKRMAQEQWEKEGKTGSAYDKDFNLLNTENFVKPERKSSLSYRRAASKEKLKDESKDEKMPQWPLAGPPTTGPNGTGLNIKPVAANNSNGRPGTSGTDHGGYSIMPNLSTTKLPPPSPKTAMPSPKPTEVIRLPEPKEDSSEEEQQQEKKPKGGCACCIIM